MENVMERAPVLSPNKAAKAVGRTGVPANGMEIPMGAPSGARTSRSLTTTPKKGLLRAEKRPTTFTAK